MYGLPSRESLSKRQSKWQREIDETVSNNPSQQVINQDFPKNPPARKSIISLMNNPIDLQPNINTESNTSLASLASTDNPMLRKNFNKPFNNYVTEPNTEFSIENIYSLFFQLTKDHDLFKQDLLNRVRNVETDIQALNHSLLQFTNENSSISSLSKNFNNRIIS